MNQLQHIKKPSKNLIKHGNKEKCNFIKNYNIFITKLLLTDEFTHKKWIMPRLGYFS